MDLALLWYVVVAAAVLMYTILDGFDLGVGIIYLLFKKDHSRRILLNAIGPVWDGNEVWLVVVLGALLGGFTPVYTALLTGFYTPTMMLIFVLIFRAVAIEFRSKKEELYWRYSWDVIFSFSSIFMAFLLGTGVGNLILGVPLDENHIFQGSVALFFRPHAMIVGICAIFLFTMHGAIFLCMKTEGRLQKKILRISLIALLLFSAVYLVTTLSIIAIAPWMVTPFSTRPYLAFLPFLSITTLFLLPRFLAKRFFGLSFLLSGLLIVSLLSLFAVGTFPILLRSTDKIENSLTIYNAASSDKTLEILITIALIGIPLVFGYGYCVYRVFRGKVRIEKQSY